MRNLNWWAKLGLCVAWDVADFTIGRTLIPVPFAGEIMGTVLATSLFGKAGLFYGLEALDVSEQIDGFAPTATLIALANRPERQQKVQMVGAAGFEPTTPSPPD